MANRSLSKPELKKLLLSSGGVCAFPGCGCSLILRDEESHTSLVTGEIAHILPFSPRGPRSSSRDSAPTQLSTNHLVLCPQHHQLIDARPDFYSAELLREMKRSHEEFIAERLGILKKSAQVELVTEFVHSSLIGLESLPRRVHRAQLNQKSTKESELWKLLEDPKSAGPYIVRDNAVYTFTSMRRVPNPFQGAVDPGTVETLSSDDLLDYGDGEAYYVALLNKSLAQHLRKSGIIFDREHKRYYFRSTDGSERRYQYRTFRGGKSTKSVVWNPITKATGRPKNFWWHLAAGLKFYRLGASDWALTIRPERHLTSNGIDPLPPTKIGRKVTKVKARMFNDKYLQELAFWRDVLSGGTPNVIIPAGDQNIAGRAELMEFEVIWPGIPGDNLPYTSNPYEDDLFSIVEYEDALYDWDDLDEEEEFDS